MGVTSNLISAGGRSSLHHLHLPIWNNRSQEPGDSGVMSGGGDTVWCCHGFQSNTYTNIAQPTLLNPKSYSNFMSLWLDGYFVASRPDNLSISYDKLVALHL